MSTVAFASDYDGTLVRGVDIMHADDVAAIKRFQESGGLFGACSGRALNCILEPADKNDLTLDFIVASSGAFVLCKNQVVESHPMGTREFMRLLGAFPQVATGLQTPTRMVVNFGPTSPNQTKVDSFDAPLGEVVYAVSLNFGDEVAAAAGARFIREEFGGELQAFQNVGSVDVVTRGCSKGQGLATVRKALAPDILAGIGDSYNDIPLLDASDMSYTFESSPEEVRRRAKRLVGSVAEALEDVSHTS